MSLLRSIQYLLLLFAAASGSSYAQQSLDPISKTAVESSDEFLEVVEAPINEGEAITKIGEWHFSLSLGYGKRTNILVDKSDFPILLVPSFKYYGEKWFFENGSLGYTLSETPTQAWSLVTELNPYVSQFYEDHLENIFVVDNLDGEVFSDIPSLSTDASADESNTPNAPVGPDDYRQVTLNKPDWSIDAGIQHNWFISSNSSVVTQLFTDISNEHNGWRFEWLYSRSFSTIANPKQHFTHNWHGVWQAGISVIDDHASQYYYGIDERHTEDSSLRYEARSAINPFVSLTLFYPLNDRSRIIVFGKYQSLDKQLRQSPKVEKNEIATYYVGVAYDF